MRKLLPLIIIVALLALQFHDFSHEPQGSNNEKHHCPICEVQSNTITITCDPIIFLIAIQIETYLLPKLERIILSPLIVLNSPARAPPHVS